MNFKKIFERLNDNTRIGNPALVTQVFGAQPETKDWNAYDARLYRAYASNRALDGMEHDAALAAADKQIWNKSSGISVAIIK